MTLSKVFPALLCILLLFGGCKKETAPVVQTATPEDIDHFSAILGGEVTDDGGLDITERGIYISSSSKPESTGDKLESTTTDMTFSNRIQGLTYGTEYFVKAYASNEEGTSYGKELSFTTLSECETLSYGFVKVVNNTGSDVWVDVTWGDVSINDERQISDGEDTTYDEIPAGSIEIWVSFDGNDWYYEYYTLEVCENLKFTWYISTKKSLGTKHK